ncbi:hypothetical protein [Iodidimonas sp. SYSU 1G8]|uniref:hypothetical protein n=1 Tax=Iodidimonas sp. SYSU 1G8 TaxID=3133967 RepID=UPI0031FE9E92
MDAFLAAWWARDFEGFLKPFRYPDRRDPLPGRVLFDAHYTERVVRFRGGLLFNGASAVVQVVTPQQPDHKHGICGGHAQSDLFLVTFYPGLDAPVMNTVQFLATDVLAETEWEHLPGAPDAKI